MLLEVLWLHVQMEADRLQGSLQDQVLILHLQVAGNYSGEGLVDQGPLFFLLWLFRS